MGGKELDEALIELCDAFNKHGVRYVVSRRKKKEHLKP